MFIDNIYLNCASLGVFRALCLNRAFDAYWSRDEEDVNAMLETLEDHIKGAFAIASSLGIQIAQSRYFQYQ